MNKDERADLEARANTMGEKAAQDAASWVFDGNTTDDTYRHFLKVWNDGDPGLENWDVERDVYNDYERETLDELEPDLGWQYTADEDVVTDAFREGFNNTYWFELERIALGHVG